MLTWGSGIEPHGPTPLFSEVESPALINAKWWVGVWETIEHWAFLGTLAIEFAASHLAKP
jgi:hypothetical protein